MNYVAGFVTAVPAANKEAYRHSAVAAAGMFNDLGVTRMVEAWGDDVPDGKITDFKGAVKAKPDEVIVFSWHEYPSKAVAEAANSRMMTDPRMAEIVATMPFDAQRMIYGGFELIVDTGAGKGDYVDGALVPVPVANKAAYSALAVEQAEIIMAHGALRVVEAWGDFVPRGKVTDYQGAVKAAADEQVVFSWVEWPSRAVRDAAWPKIFADPRMQTPDQPYDGKRRVFGGFTPIFDA